MRDLGADPAVVGEVRVDAVVLAQPVRRAVARGSQPLDVDHHGEGIEPGGQARPAEVLTVVDVQSLDVLDGRARLGGQVEGVAHQPVPVQRHLPPPAVHSGVEEYGGAGGAQQVGPRGEDAGVDQIALEMEDGALLQPAAHLVDAGDADVRAGVHRPGGELGVERKVRPPRLVHDERPPPPVAHLGDGREFGAAAVRSGAGDQRAHGVRVLGEAPLELGRGRRVRQVQPVVPARVSPHRPYPGEDQPRDHRLVRVAAHQQFLVRAGDREHGGLDGEGAAAGGEEGVLGAYRVGHQRLGPFQHAAGGAPVVEAAVRQQITVEDRVAEHLAHSRVRSARLFVPGRSEGQFLRLAVADQRVEYRRLMVIHAFHVIVLIHSHGQTSARARAGPIPFKIAPRITAGQLIMDQLPCRAKDKKSFRGGCADGQAFT